MILSNVNIGTGPSSGDGSPLRSAFSIINNNFQLITNNVNALTNSVSSVAGRTGNVILTVNDIVGLTSTNYPNAAVIGGWITANVAALVDGAPDVLNTLNEIATAINDDANIATTLTNLITSSNVAMKGYVDNTVNSANVAMKGYVDSVATLSSYGNANVASFLPTYGGNVKLDNITFLDLSEQSTAWPGAEWRSEFYSNLTLKPSWMNFYPGGSKNTFGTSFGFNSTGMFFTGDANYPAYPIRLNVGYHQEDRVEIISTIDFQHQGADNSIAIFNSNVTPAYSFSANTTRIAFNSNFGTPGLTGRTTANIAPSAVFFAGNVYTVKFVYDRNTTPSVTVSSYLGSSATGSPIDVRTLDEQLPAGTFNIGFDGDEDNAGQFAYFTELTVKSINDTVTKNLEVYGNIIPGGNVIYSLGNATHQWKDLWVSNNTIYINSVPLSIDAGGNLLVNGSPVVGGVEGNITVGNSAINFVPNSSGDGYGASTIQLIPDTNLNLDQYIIIDPTAPSHIHIRAGGAQDNSSSQLFLGGENSHVMVGAGFDPPIIVRSNSHQWTFETDGNLIFPTGGSITFDSSAASVIDGVTSVKFSDDTVQTTAYTGTGYITFSDASVKGTAGYQYTYNTDGYFTSSTSSESTNYFFVAYNVTNTNIATGWTVVGAQCDTTVANVVYPVGGYPGVIKVNLTTPASGTSGFYPVVVTSPSRLKVEIQPDPGNAAPKWTFASTGNLTLPAGGQILDSTGNLYATGGSSYGNAQVAQYLPTFTGNVQAGNVKVTSAYRFATGAVTITNGDSHVELTPDTGANALAGVKVGGNGYLLGPNASRNITLNYNSESGVVGLQSNVTVGSGGSGNLFVNGSITIRGNIINGNVAGFSIGYRDVPQISAGNVTFGLTDAGKHYYATTSAPTTLTIPSNANVAFPIGTAITIVNAGVGTITVGKQVEASLYLAGNSTNSTRTLTSYGMATLLKTATNEWFINGTGLA